MSRYIQSELLAVCPLPVSEGENGEIRLQIRSERGQTKWLTITPEQFKAIELALLGE